MSVVTRPSRFLSFLAGAFLMIAGGLMFGISTASAAPPSHSPANVSLAAADSMQISAKALTDHECNDSEWHFVITQVNAESNAPASITVTFADGASVAVPLTKFTGKVAHYTYVGHLDSTIVSAATSNYSGWPGQFNLSHGPCGTSPTSTPTGTATSTPTATATATATAGPSGAAGGAGPQAPGGSSAGGGFPAFSLGQVGGGFAVAAGLLVIIFALPMVRHSSRATA
jgi:hypothetical protein